MGKLRLFWAIIILFGMNAKAQVVYFGAELSNSQKLELFRSTTTLFTLQYKNYKDLEKFDEAIKKVWNITPYKIIKPEELSKYQSTKNYSFFSFDVFNAKNDETFSSNIIYSLALVTPSATPNKQNIYTLGYATMSPDLYTGINTQRYATKDEISRSAKKRLIGDFYNSAIFLNWSPGFLTGYLKQINDGLLNGQSRPIDFQFYNKVRLPELTKETLYVPEYVRQLFSAQQQTDHASADEKLEPYNYKLKFVSNEELDSLILSPQSDLKYLIYTRRANDKIISVYESKNNQIIYQVFSPQSPEVELNDLNKIKQTIKTIE